MNLEQELHALAAALDWPPAPDVTEAVLARLDETPRPRRVFPRHRLAIVVAVVVAAVAATLAVPQARTAILRALGIGSVRVVHVDELPTAALRSDLSNLGPVLTRDEADELAPFPLLRFDRDRLGKPDEIRGIDLPSSVSYVWRAGDGGVRLLVSQLSGRVEEKGFIKVAGPGVKIDELTVDGHQAFWITGEAHGFGIDRGTFDFEELRLSGNALLVNRGDLVIRIEGDFDRDEALAVYHALS